MRKVFVRTIAIVLCLMFVMTALSSCVGGSSSIESEDDLKNVKIGVIDGSKGVDLANTYAERNCEIIRYDSRVELKEAFENDEIDCALLDENHAAAFVSDNDGYKLLDDRIGDEENYAFSTLATKKVYKIMLNKALATLREDGTLDSIVNGYLNDPEYVYEFATELDNSNGSFTIALDPSLYPYVYPADETHDMPRGIELAVIDAVCRYLGCDYTLITPTTSSLASTLITGIADFAIGSYILPTVEDLEIVETDPVLTYRHAIVTKK